jgi:hypothetical protein
MNKNAATKNCSHLFGPTSLVLGIVIAFRPSLRIRAQGHIAASDNLRYRNIRSFDAGHG